MRDYWDQYGLLSGPGRGNSILYGIEYGIFSGTLDEQLQPIIKNCQITPGLFRRHPDLDQDGESWDDYKALCFASSKIARQVFWYGLTHFGIYRNSKQTPVMSAWLWRSPTFVAWVFSCAFPWVRFIVAPILNYGIDHTSKNPEDQDGMILTYLLIRQLNLKSRSSEDFTAVLQFYWGGIKPLLAAYFSDPENPIVKCL